MESEQFIAVIGLGYVGLPLAVEFAKKYPVVGFDINCNRVRNYGTAMIIPWKLRIDDLKKVLSSNPGSAGLYLHG